MTTEVAAANSEQVAADEAWRLHRRIVALKSGLTAGWLELASYLRLMRDRRLYELLGAASFEEYLASPEVTISRSSVYRLLAVLDATGAGAIPTLGPEPAEPLLTAAQVEAIGISRVEAVLPVLRAVPAEAREEWIARARESSVRDLRQSVKEHQAGAVWSARQEVLQDAARRLGALAGRLPYAPDPVAVLAEIGRAVGETARRLEDYP